MKSKSIAICILIGAVVILAGIWLLFRPKALVNMNGSYTESTTSISNVSFSGEAGERIKFSLKSDVKQGDLNILLYDSQGNAVFQMDKAKELQIFYTLDKTDTYKLTAEYTDFIGKFKVAVYESRE